MIAQRPLAYMAALDLAGRRCVVIGGGATAARRARGLLDAGGMVTLIATHIDGSLASLAAHGDITWLQREYREGDLDGAAVVFNTADDPALEQVVHAGARRAGALINTHDQPSACDFASPALVRRGRLQIAVSTSGDSPHLAAAMRERLESMIGPEWGLQLSLIATVRRRLRMAGTAVAEQQRVYRRLMRGRVREELRRRPAAAARMATDAVQRAASPSGGGTVHLVGAGPGDAGLLTVAARDLLLEADVVFHDALVSPAVLRSRGGGAHTAQERIIAMLIDAARSGQSVVRLKGGDPFVFGRGGEEVAALRAAGVDVHVVPGVSSALAAAASADIALTHRGVSGSIAIVSGQGADGEARTDLARVAAAVDTVVVLMPLRTLDRVTACLQEAVGAAMPAALVSDATMESQRVVRAPLGEIADIARDAGVASPATLIVGRVVDVLGDGGLDLGPRDASKLIGQALAG